MRGFIIYREREGIQGEVVIVVAKNSMRARSIAQKQHFKDSKYFDLRWISYPDIKKYLDNKTEEPMLITGEDESFYPLLKKLGWFIP